MRQPAIKLDHVTVELGGEIILRDVNLEIQHGETLVIIGPSGSGKTVLLKTMAGIYSPKEGHVFCEGEDWQNLKSEQKHELARKIGVQFQKSALFDSLSAAENIAFPMREHTKMTEKQIEDRVSYCLEAVGLSHARDLLPHDLSGGMRQRLGIARAIALEPEIIFYDDPTAGLDPVNSDKMAELILELKAKQKDATLIVVTHDMLRAYQLAGRIVLVADQSVIETGNAEETKKNPDPRVQQYIHGRLVGPLTSKNGGF